MSDGATILLMTHAAAFLFGLAWGYSKARGQEWG